MAKNAGQEISLEKISEAERYRTLLEINNAIISNLKREDLFQAISQALRRVVPFDRTAIFLHDSEKRVFRLFALESSSPTPHFMVGFEIAPDESHMDWAFRHQRYLLRRDLSEGRHYKTENLLFDEGIRSVLTVPLIAGGRSIGTLNVASTNKNQYAEPEALFLQEVANQIALAIENMRAYEKITSLNAKLQTPAERYRTLLEINNAIITNLTREDLFHAICGVLKSSIAFDRAGLALYEPTIDALRVFALVGELNRFVVGQTLPLTDHDSGRTLDFQRVRLLRDLETQREHSIDHLIYAEGIHSYCTAPLTVQGVAIGTIGVGSVNKNRYSEADVEFLQEVANQVALAVGNMKAYEEIKALSAKEAASAEHRRTLLEINNAIITNLTREELLSKIFAAVQRVIPFDKVAISLYESERDGYRILAQEGPLQLKHFFVGQVIGHQEHYVTNEFDFERPLLLPNLQVNRQNELEESLYADGVRSFCAVPLRVHGALLGALSVASQTTEQYSKADAKFLQEIGNQIALALANMKSYEEIRALSGKEAAIAQRHRTLLEINNAVITSLTQDELLRACRILGRVIRFDLAAISFYDEELDALRFFALEGASAADYVAYRLLYRHDNGSGQTLAFEQPILLPDLERARQFNFVQQLYADGFRSFCAAPLMVQGKLVGALGVLSKTTDSYKATDLEFLQEVANQIALAVANMKSYEQIAALNARERATAERRRTLLEINNAIVTNLEQKELFHAIFRALQHATPFDKVGLTFYEPELDGLRFFALEGETSNLFAVGKVLDRKDCCFGEAFDTQRPVLRRDLEKERLYLTDDYLFSEGLHSYCTVPLIVQGQSIGAISLVSTIANQYSEEDAEFLQEVANQVALAVANMRSYEEIAALKARLQAENLSLQETAALMGRFAAALSHELNSPLGALKSAVQSSQVLAQQKVTLPPEKRDQLEKIESQLRRTVADSVERLHQVVLRMQRFTNLDRTQVLAVDMNSLLQDVADLLESQTNGRVRLELDLKPLPRIVVRPQQMSSVFLSLLQNALEESNGSERVVLASRRTDSEVQVIVQDDGKGMSSEEVTRLFDPAFKVKAGRISTGNWSLFSSRQIIQEHGGQIEIQSAVGKGTLVRVALPC